LAAARKHSSTSSKPPSSDIVKPKKPRGKDGKKRKRGGQPGHKRHERPEFPPGMIDEFICHTLDSCPDCGGEFLFSRRADPNVVQQAELIDSPLWITEHRMLAYWCPHCRKVHYAPVPETVAKTGLFGPRLTTLVAFMKGVCHASFSTIRTFLRDVVGLKVSRGYLATLIAKVTEWLTPAYEELLARLPGEAFLNVDETGHKENAKKFWTWCFRAELYTLFRIKPSRGSEVLVHHHTGHRTDQQSGGTGDPLRRDRPADHARHSPRNWPPLVRTHLDTHRQRRAARPIGFRILVRIGRISSSRCSPAFAHAVRPLTASLRSLVYASLRDPMLGLRTP